LEAIEKAGHKGKVKLGMDCAASEYYVADKKCYDLDFKTENNDGS
jgi:enolase